MEQDLAFFEANPEKFDALSDGDRAMLANGHAVEVDGAGDPATAQEGVGADQAQEEAHPVLLARDGKHAIPYDELVTAREQARQYEQMAREQAAIIEALRTQQAATAQEKSSEDGHAATLKALDDHAATLKALKLEFAEAQLIEDEGLAEEIWAKIEALQEGKTRALVQQEFEARDAQARAQQAQANLDATVAAVIASYPFLDSNSPVANQAAIADVVRWRNALASEGVPIHEALAQAAEKFAPLYATKQPAASADAAAAAAIANAKARPPASMSSIPSSATPPNDEMQAMSSMSVQALQDKMMTMDPSKIMELLNRTVLV